MYLLCAMVPKSIVSQCIATSLFSNKYMDVCITKERHGTRDEVQGTYCYNIPDFIVKKKHGLVRNTSLPMDILEMVTFRIPGIEYFLFNMEMSLVNSK
jgi:hypothetical protein